MQAWHVLFVSGWNTKLSKLQCRSDMCCLYQVEIQSSVSYNAGLTCAVCIRLKYKAQWSTMQAWHVLFVSGWNTKLSGLQCRPDSCCVYQVEIRSLVSSNAGWCVLCVQGWNTQLSQLHCWLLCQTFRVSSSCGSMKMSDSHYKIMNQTLMVIQSILGCVGLTLDRKWSVLFSDAATCTSIYFSQAAWPDFM